MTKEQEAYLILQEASGLKIGDTVKILRRANNYEMGWENIWDIPAMSNYIGIESKITDINGNGIVLNNDYAFPFFVLEKISSAKPKDPIIEFIEKANFRCNEERLIVKKLVEMILKRMEPAENASKFE